MSNLYVKSSMYSFGTSTRKALYNTNQNPGPGKYVSNSNISTTSVK